MDTVPGSTVRIALIAGQTVREAVRQRLPRLLAAMLAASTAAVLVLRDFHLGTTEQRFMLDAGFGAEALFGSVFAIVATAQLFFRGTEHRTVLMVLAKPVRRAELIGGQLGGVLLLLLAFCAAVTALLVGLVWAQIPGSVPAGAEAVRAAPAALCGGIALGGLVQWLKLSVLAAVTLLVATFARSSLFAVIVAFAVLVAGHLHPLARDFYAATGPAWAAAGVRWLSLALPDFQIFNVADRVTAGDSLSIGTLAGIAGYALAYLGVLSALAVYCFERREL